MTDPLAGIQEWYVSQCDGDWEHMYGVSLGTLDNPGWTLTIELQETQWQDIAFSEVSDLDPDQDWYSCRKQGPVFKAACGPRMLGTVFRIFLDWTKQTAAQSAA